MCTCLCSFFFFFYSLATSSCRPSSSIVGGAWTGVIDYCEVIPRETRPVIFLWGLKPCFLLLVLTLSRCWGGDSFDKYWSISYGILCSNIGTLIYSFLWPCSPVSKSGGDRTSKGCILWLSEIGNSYLLIPLVWHQVQRAIDFSVGCWEGLVIGIKSLWKRLHFCLMVALTFST